MFKIIVNDKKFGKNYIDYKVIDKTNNEVVTEGKCKNHSHISSIFFGLVNEYGVKNVILLNHWKNDGG